ncbi:MAG: GSCFA domain-containing protein [Bacteroidia bacterium]
MEFKLNFSIAKPDFNIHHQHKILLVGSCFASNIGDYLQLYKFKTCLNPCGIVFNPISVANTFKFILSPDTLTDNYLFTRNGLWHSWMHHGSFNHHRLIDFKKKIVSSINNANNFIHSADYIFITLGSAHAYKHLQLNEFVANCHKMPANLFQKILLKPNQVTETLGSTIKNIQFVNPNAKFVFTVSPVKYIKDGLHENNISKGILHYAINEICSEFKNTYYFPAYEIVNDELRDYRFYKPDFAHPTEQAVDYVWKRFCETYFNEQTNALTEEIRKIKSAMAHKPLHKDSTEYKSFLSQMLVKTQQLQNQHPEIDFTGELSYFGNSFN